MTSKIIDMRKLGRLELNGSRCDQLNRTELFDGLVKIGVPGITKDMGCLDLMLHYEAHLADADAKSRGQPSTYNVAHETVKDIQADADKAKPTYDVGALPSSKDHLTGRTA